MKILFTLITLALSAGSAQAYSHSFTNNTKVPVRFWANYAACSNDTWEPVNPGETITWRSGLCCIKPPNVKVLDIKDEQFSGRGEWKADWILSTYIGLPFGSMEPLLCRNSNWRFVFEDSKGPRLEQH